MAIPEKYEGRWITIGSNKSAPPGEKGGARVYIEDGKIVAGPKALEGKSLDNLSGKKESGKKPRKTTVKSGKTVPSSSSKEPLRTDEKNTPSPAVPSTESFRDIVADLNAIRSEKTIAGKLAAMKSIDKARDDILKAGTEHELAVAEHEAAKREFLKADMEYRNAAPKDLRAAQYRHIAAEDAMVKARDMAKKTLDEQNKRIKEILSLPEEHAAKINAIRKTGGIEGMTDESIKDAHEWLYGLVRRTSEFPTVDVMYMGIEDGMRARYISRTIKIALPKTLCSASTVAHEIGHLLEGRIENKNAITEWLKSRFSADASATRKLAEEFPGRGHGADEVSYGEDNFESVFLAFGDSPNEAKHKAMYTSRRYGGTDSEIVSMGVELLKKNAALFAKMEPEWFKLCVAVMRGML